MLLEEYHKLLAAWQPRLVEDKTCPHCRGSGVISDSKLRESQKKWKELAETRLEKVLAAFEAYNKNKNSTTQHILEVKLELLTNIGLPSCWGNAIDVPTANKVLKQLDSLLSAHPREEP